MHQASHIGADRSELHDPDLRRSIDFHAVLLAMAGHDLRQHLQIILAQQKAPQGLQSHLSRFSINGWCKALRSRTKRVRCVIEMSVGWLARDRLR
jgi:hypothetical protein